MEVDDEDDALAGDDDDDVALLVPMEQVSEIQLIFHSLQNSAILSRNAKPRQYLVSTPDYNI